MRGSNRGFTDCNMCIAVVLRIVSVLPFEDQCFHMLIEFRANFHFSFFYFKCSEIGHCVFQIGADSAVPQHLSVAC